MEVSTPLIDIVLNNINKLTENIDKNTFIENARKSIKEDINSFDIAEDEKAKLVAQYEAQVSIATISEIMKLAKEIPLNEAQIKNSDSDTAIKEEQLNLVKQEVRSEKGKVDLIIQQIVSEQYRQRDLRASIIVKINSNEVTKQQAKFEEARRHIAVISNNQNVYMKKADYKVQQLQALAQDDDVTISNVQIDDTKTTIDNIPTTEVQYNSEVNINNTQIETTAITPITIPE